MGSADHSGSLIPVLYGQFFGILEVHKGQVAVSAEQNILGS